MTAPAPFAAWLAEAWQQRPWWLLIPRCVTCHRWHWWQFPRHAWVWSHDAHHFVRERECWTCYAQHFAALDALARESAP